MVQYGHLTPAVHLLMGMVPEQVAAGDDHRMGVDDLQL